MLDPNQLDTRYAKSGELNIAYQMFGSGELNLVLIPGWASHVENIWTLADFAAFAEKLAHFARVVMIDRRGTGLSDPVSNPPTLEERMDDVRAVLDAVGWERAAIWGISEGGPMAMMFAATYPARTQALLLYGTFARFSRGEGYPHGYPAEVNATWVPLLRLQLGHRRAVAPLRPQHHRRQGDDAHPGQAGADGHEPGHGAQALRPDDRARCPARAAGDPRADADPAPRRRPADARRPCPLPGRAHRRRPVRRARRQRITCPGAATPTPCSPRRANSSPASAPRPSRTASSRPSCSATSPIRPGDWRKWATLGWKQVLASFYALADEKLRHFRGRKLDTAGDGLFAAFDGPARAVRCGASLARAVEALGLRLRVGVHTGECEVLGEKYSGMAVHVGARVAAVAEPGQVLVSSTVKNLVVGSGLRFDELGPHALKGVPGEWHLFAATAS